VWSRLIVVADVLLQDAPCVFFRTDNNLIQKFCPHGTNPALSERILPWGADGRVARSESTTFNTVLYRCAEDRVMIKDQITKLMLPGKSLFDLLGDPESGGMEGYIEVPNTSCGMLDHEPAIQSPTREYLDGEKIHGEDGRGLIFEEGFPAITQANETRILRKQPLDISTQRGEWDSMSQVHQFGLNPYRSPERIFRNDLLENTDDFPVLRGASGWFVGQPDSDDRFQAMDEVPEGVMPAHERLRLDNKEKGRPEIGR